MQFRTIRTALNYEGKVIRIEDLTPCSRGVWYCYSCKNPLRLRWTHDNGGYFVHDLEEAEESTLKHCEYQQSPLNKPTSAFNQAVNNHLARNEKLPRVLPPKDYFCVLCQHQYYGPRCCPKCKQYIYSTEVKALDTQTIPVTFVK